jgi:hypothetical protein
VYYLSRGAKIAIAVSVVLALSVAAYLLVGVGRAGDAGPSADPTTTGTGGALRTGAPVPRPEVLPQVDITDEACLVGAVTPIRELMARYASGTDLSAARELNQWSATINDVCSPEDAAGFYETELYPWLHYTTPHGWVGQAPPATEDASDAGGDGEPVVIEIDLDELMADEG